MLDRMELTGPPSSQRGVYKIPGHRLSLTVCPMPDLEAAQSAVGGEGCKGENTADSVDGKDQAHTTGAEVQELSSTSTDERCQQGMSKQETRSWLEERGAHPERMQAVAEMQDEAEQNGQDGLVYFVKAMDIRPLGKLTANATAKEVQKSVEEVSSRSLVAWTTIHKTSITALLEEAEFTLDTQDDSEYILGLECVNQLERNLGPNRECQEQCQEILEIDTDTDCTQECIDAKDPSEELEVYWTSEFGTLSWSDDDTEQQAAEKPTATAATDRDQDQEICAAIERSMQVQMMPGAKEDREGQFMEGHGRVHEVRSNEDPTRKRIE